MENENVMPTTDSAKLIDSDKESRAKIGHNEKAYAAAIAKLGKIGLDEARGDLKSSAAKFTLGWEFTESCQTGSLTMKDAKKVLKSATDSYNKIADVNPEMSHRDDASDQTVSQFALFGHPIVQAKMAEIKSALKDAQTLAIATKEKLETEGVEFSKFPKSYNFLLSAMASLREIHDTEGKANHNRTKKAELDKALPQTFYDKLVVDKESLAGLVVAKTRKATTATATPVSTNPVDVAKGEFKTQSDAADKIQAAMNGLLEMKLSDGKTPAFNAETLQDIIDSFDSFRKAHAVAAKRKIRDMEDAADEAIVKAEADRVAKKKNGKK